MNVIWKPSEKQVEALTRTEFEVLYGGARGGGKTDAGQAWLLYDIEHPALRELVIRRNADDLKDWIDRAKKMYQGTGAVFVGSPVEIKFPSGALIRVGHLKDENAYTKYQGHEYQRVLVEELTQIPSEDRYLKLISSCRSSIKELKAQVFNTTNPGNAGHEWVKERWGLDDKSSWGKPITDEVSGKSRIFIPARIEDNPHLMEADPTYVNFLESLSEGLKQQWREGSWDDYDIEGAYYGQQIKRANEEGRITNVPYEERLPVDTWWDLGMNDTTVIWFSQSVGRETRFIDYYEQSGEGLQHYAKVLQSKPYVYRDYNAPHDIEVRELGTGKSRIEVAKQLGINFKVVRNIPVEDGIEAVRNILGRCWFDRDKCKEGIRALKNYRKDYDEKRKTFRPSPLHDWSSHASDAFRYFAVGHSDQLIKSGVRRERIYVSDKPYGVDGNYI